MLVNALMVSAVLIQPVGGFGTVTVKEAMRCDHVILAIASHAANAIA